MGIKLKNVYKKFNDKNVLDDVNVEFSDNEFVCVLGRSGCGKTTLLNLIAGLDTPSSGQIFMDSNEIKGPGVDRAVMFQDAALFPWLNVIENIEFSMISKNISKREKNEKAQYYLEMVNLLNFQNYYIHELSGGMKQRVALARALGTESKILLMDEPFSALDNTTKSILREELISIWEKTKKTIIFVTHNIREALELSDRTIVMGEGTGKIKNQFIISNPRNLDSKSIKNLSYDIGLALN